ncbi:probable RNA-binding protein 18 isoform X2 [Gossypium hirsutum]|uniref:Probable RNA-binding protein 18 isoform X2 n=1 Tax=Gossypium hirsutum TaxID=3635 RepID=A0A1U8JE35_GOSHI|nr:probable RNA-binding protein 18 isoform X2 [Gossypium hirsutum]XP_016686510.1 probable RNA-binding protein 18 isoform X2 [Gossypium hirsutum]
MDPRSFADERSESRLYVGNLDLRITEAALIKMFSPYGKIISEDFLWHTRGPKRGEPRGFAFIQYSTKELSCLFFLSLCSFFGQVLISTFKVSMQEAKLAKEKMHGRLACGRPLMVRLASEKYLEEAAAQNSSKAGCNTIKSGTTSTISGQVSRSAKIAAIKNKLKALDEERDGAKKPKAS